MIYPRCLLLLTLVFSLGYCSFLCGVCEKMVQISGMTFKFLIPNFVAVEGLSAICMRRYDSEILCQRIGQQIAPLAINNFISRHIDPDRRCSSVCESNYIPYNAQKQVQRILNGQPLKVDLSKYYSIQKFNVKQQKILSILHLSDIHQDNTYTVNASVSCQYPICCHSYDGFPQNPQAQAKKFGNIKCDSPPQLLQSFLDFIKDQLQIDMVLITGDQAAHNEWQKTQKSIKQVQQQIINKIQRSFPNAVVVKSEGNNDYMPDHQYDGSKQPRLLKIVQVTSGQTELVFISLNTIAFDNLNLFLLGDQSYSIFQLMILETLLQKYDNVYLMGHISPVLDGVANQFSTVYRALIAKYSKKVKGQFYGHVHSDQMTVNTYPNSQVVTGFGFLAPSISPFHVGSSRARVYSLATGQNNGVIDYTQYNIKDLSSKTAQWNQQYKFRHKHDLIQQKIPITIKQIEQIKNKILNNKSEQIKYLKTSGLDKQYGTKVHCNVIDDNTQRAKCKNRSQGINDKILNLLQYIRGSWGYKKKQME